MTSLQLTFSVLAAFVLFGAPALAGDELKLDSEVLDAFDWRSIGPANMGGRCVALAVYEADPSLYWVATASGGLLKTTNAGNTYEHQFDHENTVSIGHVAVAQSDPQIVWVGTGEANPRNSVSYGDGVYKSVDGGETWEHMGLEKTFQIGRIAIHPENPDVVYVGALGRLYGRNEERGLYKTIDGGQTWERILYVDDGTGVIDVDMHPGEPDTLVVATYEREREGFDTDSPTKNWGPGAGIYRTEDGGQTWMELMEGLPEVDMGRIGVDYCRGNPDVLFAVIETERIGKLPDDAAFLGLTCEDAEVGARITAVTEEGPGAAAGLEEGDLIMAIDDRRIIDYAELMRVVREHKAGDTIVLEIVREREYSTVELTFGEIPEDQRERTPFGAFLGGQRENRQDDQGRGKDQTGGIYKSADGGSSWERVNSLNPRPMYYSQIRVDPSDEQRVYVLGTSLYRSEDGGVKFTGDGGGRGVHVDHHALWIDPADGRHMVLGNDGGIYITQDRMENWDHHNHVAIGQFYHVTVGPRPFYWVYGGLQDNGSWGGPNRTRTYTGPVNTDWISIGGGDGFVCRVDPEDPDQIYFESQVGSMGSRNLRTGERGYARPQRQEGVRYRFNWETPYLLSNHNSRIFYAAGNHVFRSLNRGRDLRAISPEITLTDEGSATALAESPHDPDVLWVGTDDGALWATRDGGENWIDLLQPPPADELLPGDRRDAVLVGLLEGLDQDDDGQVQASEVPESLRAVFARADVNADGVIDAVEFELLTGTEPVEPAEDEGTIDPDDPLDGNWKAQAIDEDIPEDEGGFELVFKQNAEGQRIGQLTSDMGEGPLSDIVFDAEAGTLKCHFASDMMDLDIDAKLGEAGLTGELIVAGGEFRMQFSAERQVAEEDETAEPSEERGPTLAELLPEPMWISSLEASRHQAGRLYCAVDGHRSDRDEPFAFVSEDWGATWTSLTDDLPRGSTRCLREDLVNPDVLWLGTEFGAFVTIDRGQSWTKVRELPTVSVHDFAQHPTVGDVVAGTHGRSLWAMNAATLRQLTPEALAADAWLFQPPTTYRWRSEPSRGSSGTRRFAGENPPADVPIYYRLASKAEQVKLSVLGTGGEELAVLETEEQAGLHRVSWNMRRAQQNQQGGSSRRRFGGGRSVDPGTYQLVLEVDGQRWTRPLVIESDPDFPEAPSGFGLGLEEELFGEGEQP